MNGHERSVILGVTHENPRTDGGLRDRRIAVCPFHRSFGADRVESASAEKPTEEQSGPTESSEVTVTGTRIRLPNTVSQEPIVTIGSDYLEARNLTNVADALNEIPGFRSASRRTGLRGRLPGRQFCTTLMALVRTAR